MNAQDIAIEAAAKKLAECLDYPWEYMAEHGRVNMRETVTKAAQPLILAERNEIARLRAQLAVAARGLKHCAGWGISDEKRDALMAVVIESEAMLASEA